MNIGETVTIKPGLLLQAFLQDHLFSLYFLLQIAVETQVYVSIYGLQTCSEVAFGPNTQ